MSDAADSPDTLDLPGLDPGPETPARPSRGPSREQLLEGLNEPQRAAVVHEGAPLLVVAGAGSGKTRVLTRRIAWTISERGAHPGSILAITFTNKAAAEMKERVEELVGRRARIMWVSTFHSACVRILRKEADKLGWKSNFSIYDAQDQKRLMTLVAQDLDLDVKRYQPGALLHWVSNHKNELRDAEQVAADAKNKLEETYAAAYSLYQRRLREANALDFDDLIMTTVHLFEAFPEVKETYRRRFRHVLVDEYQDTNHAQYALIHALCADPLEDPLDAAILFAPAGDIVPIALAALDRGGTLAIAGIHLSDIPALHYADHLFQERQVRSVTANTRRDGEDFLALAARASLHVQTTTYELGRAQEALADLAHDRVDGAAVLRVDG